MSLTIRLDVTKQSFGPTMAEIRAWLEPCSPRKKSSRPAPRTAGRTRDSTQDRERIYSTGFKHAEAGAGLAVEISFATEMEAEQFRQRFLGC